MSKRYRHKHILRLLATGALAGVCSPAGASGFQLIEQNATNLGTAYAGTASLAEDASTGFYNAAGLTRIGKEQIALSLVGSRPIARFDVTTATNNAGAAVSGVPGNTRVRGDTLVPGVHYAYHYDDNWAFGLNITSPFGLNTKYNTNSIARYMSSRSNIRTYDIAPSVAYCLGNGFSIGFGPDLVHTYLQFDNLFFSGGQDVLVETRLNRWGVGGHVGVLYEFSDCTRVGLNYRSQVEIKGKGQTTASNPAAQLLVSGADAKIKLPDTAVLSVFHQFDDCWAVMADAQWTHWSLFKSLTINNASADNTNIFTTVARNFNFKDTYRLALGVSYQWDECGLVRLGTAYDRSPVRGSNFRTTRIPDSHRIWAALGGRYNFTKCLALDVGYAHLFLKKANINDAGPLFNGATKAAINGKYSNRGTDMLGVQLTWDLA